jgi:hypothetical protein
MKRRVFIECTGHSGAGARYRVTDENGRLLVASSRFPEFDAARALLAEGVTGEMEVWRPAGAFPSMRLDIEKAAIGPRFVAWEINSLYKSENGDDNRPTAVE